MDKDGFNSMLKQAQKLINQTLKFSISLVIMLLYINKNTYKKNPHRRIERCFIPSEKC